MGTIGIVEAIRKTGFKTKFHEASSSKKSGKVKVQARRIRFGSFSAKRLVHGSEIDDRCGFADRETAGKESIWTATTIGI